MKADQFADRRIWHFAADHRLQKAEAVVRSEDFWCDDVVDLAAHNGPLLCDGRYSGLQPAPQYFVREYACVGQARVRRRGWLRNIKPERVAFGGQLTRTDRLDCVNHAAV